MYSSLHEHRQAVTTVTYIREVERVESRLYLVEYIKTIYEEMPFFVATILCLRLVSKIKYIHSRYNRTNAMRVAIDLIDVFNI